MTLGIEPTKSFKELELDWFDAIAMDESQVADMEYEVNTERKMAWAKVRGGRPG